MSADKNAAKSDYAAQRCSSCPRRLLTDREMETGRCWLCRKAAPPLDPPYCHHQQGGTCPRCGAARTPDGFCSACFVRGLR